MNLNDPVLSTFEICDINNDDGLTREETLEDKCKDTLEKWFGFTEQGLNEIFPKLDSNNDDKISLDEGRVAFEGNRSFNHKVHTCEDCRIKCEGQMTDTNQIMYNLNTRKCGTVDMYNFFFALYLHWNDC